MLMKNKRHLLVITLFIIILSSIPHSKFSALPAAEAEVDVQSLTISIYTDKYAYSEGDTMHLGLDIVNTGPAANVCLEIWLEKPDTSTVTILHAHDIMLPHGLNYSDPSFRSFMLPNLPPGVYTWHAAILDPPTHDVLLEDMAEFVTGEVVTIGVILPWEYDLDRYGPIFDYAETDINAYCSKLGYEISFNFLFEHADGNASVHLEKVQFFNTIDVNLLVAGFWSGQAQGSLSYVNANDMLMFSPSSTSPLLSIPDDNLFRMCSDDTLQASAMVEILNSYDEGIEAVVLIQRADSWGDGLYDEFEAQYVGSGGVIWERLRYDPETSDFSAYLSTANGAMHSAVAFYGWDHVAVQLFGMSESVQLLNQSQYYSAIYNVTWFGSESTALHYGFDDIPEVANHTKVYSPTAAPTKSWKWWEIYDRYHNETGQTMTFYMGCVYDICWTYAKAVLEARTTDTNVVKGILGDVAGDFFGVTGPCRLNDAGDRYATNYDIWGYGGHYGYDWYLYGVYNRFTGEVHWDEDLIPWR
jgi:branched-chain amino acid transport system substrate-binding protein